MNKKVIEQIANVLKFDVEELTKVLNTEGEVDFVLPNGKFLNSTEIEQIKDNHGKTRYDAGKTAGVEMLLKDLSEKVGFNEAVKDPDLFITTYKQNILKEAEIEPNKKVVELETSLESLRKKLSEKENEFSTFKDAQSKEKFRLEAMSFVPDLPENLGIKKNEAIDIILNGIEYKDGSLFKNGEALKDELESPISLNTYIDNFVKERGWNSAPIGRGGGARAESKKINTINDFEQEIKQKGLHPGSAEAQALLAQAVKDNPALLS